LWTVPAAIGQSISSCGSDGVSRLVNAFARTEKVQAFTNHTHFEKLAAHCDPYCFVSHAGCSWFCRTLRLLVPSSELRQDDGHRLRFHQLYFHRGRRALHGAVSGLLPLGGALQRCKKGRGVLEQRMSGKEAPHRPLPRQSSHAPHCARVMQAAALRPPWQSRGLSSTTQAFACSANARSSGCRGAVSASDRQ